MDSGVSECQAFRNEGGTLFQNAGSFTRVMHFDPEVANEELDLFGSLADGCSVDIPCVLFNGIFYNCHGLYNLQRA